MGVYSKIMKTNAKQRYKIRILWVDGSRDRYTIDEKPKIDMNNRYLYFKGKQLNVFKMKRLYINGVKIKIK